MGMISDAVVARFWSKVSLPDENGCMIWLAGISKYGYGVFSVNNKQFRAHRFSLLLSTGEMPDDMEGAHAPEVCHNRACVSPLHLRWATRVENELDKRIDGTHSSGERHGGSKLSFQQVADIRRLYASGTETYRSIAAKYDVSFKQVYNIVKEKNWV